MDIEAVTYSGARKAAKFYWCSIRNFIVPIFFVKGSMKVENELFAD